jgi:putative ABC transport system permease protein
MLSPRWRKVARDLWLHKFRTGLVVSAICIGIVGAGAVLDAWSLLRRVTHDEFDASNPASATLRTDSIDDALLVRVRAMPAIASAQARRTAVASIQTSEGWRTAWLMAANDFTTNRIGVIKPDRGTWPPRDGSIVVEHSSVEFSGVSIGDSVRVQFGDSTAQTLTVGGVVRDVGLAPGWMEHVVYAFVTPKTLAQLGASSSMSELQLVVRDRTMDRAAVQRVAREVKQLVESTGRHVSDVNVPVPGRHIHAAQIDSLLYTQGAFGLLAMLLSGILVVNLISAMLTGQVREIGVMKAMGAGANQIAAMYLALALILGLIACAISIPIAAWLGRRYAEFTTGILNFDISGFTIPVWTFVLQLAVGALLPVVAAAIPVVRGCRISVSEALRDFGIAERTDRGSSRLFAFEGLSRPLLLSLRNAFRRRQRMVLTLATMSVGGAVYLGAINLRAAIVGSMDLLFASQHYDMTFRFATPYAADSLVAVASIVPGVARAEAWGRARAAVSGPDALGNTFAIAAPPLASRMLVVPVDTGRWLRAGSANELVVNVSLLADSPELSLGREVALVIDGKVARWTIVGVGDTGPMPMSFTSRETLERLSGKVGATSMVVAANAGASTSELALIRRLRAALVDAGFDVSSSQLMSEQRAVIEDHLLMVAGFLGSMSLLMIVVGGLGLASTMSLAVLERTREIGVLRAIGARHGAILAMVQIEGLVIAILSWALAIPLSLPMSIALENAFGRVMLKVPVRLVPEGSGVLVWFGVVVVMSVVACAWPALRATRITTAAALAYE